MEDFQFISNGKDCHNYMLEKILNAEKVIFISSWHIELNYFLYKDKPLYKISSVSNLASLEKRRRRSKFDAFKLNNLCFKLNQLINENIPENKFICLADFGKESLTGVTFIIGRIFAENSKKVKTFDKLIFHF